MARAGLVKKVKSVHSAHGMVKRSYWVKAQDTAKRAGVAVRGAAGKAAGVISRNKGKIAGAAALVGAAVIAHKHRGAIGGALKGAHVALKTMRGVNSLAGKVGMSKPYSRGEQVKNAGSAAIIGGVIGHRKDSARREGKSGQASVWHASVGKDTPKHGFIGGLIHAARGPAHAVEKVHKYAQSSGMRK